jgi:hypothetical protein
MLDHYTNGLLKANQIKFLSFLINLAYCYCTFIQGEALDMSFLPARI